MKRPCLHTVTFEEEGEKHSTCPRFPVTELAYDLGTEDAPSNKQLLNQESKEVSAIHNLGPGDVMPDLPVLAVILAVWLLPLA
ncbi:Glypican-3 [Varanus komodoensis]|nr:Glypican-3 [Varanus komodoensis]